MSVLLKWLMVVATPLVLAQSPQKAELPFQQSQESALYASGQPTSLISEENPPQGENEPLPSVLTATEDPESGLEAYIRLEAKNYGVSEDLATYIVFNESRYNPRAVGDTHLICPFTGEKQRSRGLWQWSDCFNPQVSDEQAFNFITSTELAMKELAKGEERCKQLWTTCRKYYAQTQTD